jgi:hypothetical protein
MKRAMTTEQEELRAMRAIRGLLFTAATSGGLRRQSDRELIDAVRADYPELTEQEAIRDLKLFGGL